MATAFLGHAVCTNHSLPKSFVKRAGRAQPLGGYAFLGRWLYAAFAVLWLAVALAPLASRAADLGTLIPKARQSVVAVGVYEPAKNPPFAFRGTGFAVSDGRYIVTNAHVVPAFLDPRTHQRLIVMIGRAADAKAREVEKVATDVAHDLVLLRLKGGDPLPSLRLADGAREGQEVAFTGYPLGTVLGLFPVTHRGMISSITPIITPGANARELDAKALKNLRAPFEVYQLDATAYPGNSGSPVYDSVTGDVLGILNMVFVKGSKEKAITDPSGISYAIPVEHIKRLLERAEKK